MYTVSVDDSLPALPFNTARFGYKVSQKCTNATACCAPYHEGPASAALASAVIARFKRFLRVACWCSTLCQITSE